MRRSLRKDGHLAEGVRQEAWRSPAAPAGPTAAGDIAIRNSLKLQIGLKMIEQVVASLRESAGPRPQLLPPTLEAWEPRQGTESIAVLMSGGVDSSVTALLLRDAGWDVVGVTMKIPAPDGCCGAAAAVVCDQLDVPHYFIDVRKLFQNQVIEPFRQAYQEGKTPSPCVDCNTMLKFDAVWKALQEGFGIRHLATGHYARVIRNGRDVHLARGIDRRRDQSYFLYGIKRERLPYLHLPLGHYKKPVVRQIAAKYGLAVATKPDSMELCFAGEGDYRGLFKQVATEAGPIYDLKGVRLGEHRGIHHYTIGQRHGLGIASPHPLYVLRISARDNAVIVGPREKAETRVVQVEDLNVLMPDLMEEGRLLWGRIRSNAKLTKCVVNCREGKGTVLFSEPVFAPAPGQHLVLYDDAAKLVAGGTIRPISDYETFTEGR